MMAQLLTKNPPGPGVRALPRVGDPDALLKLGASLVERGRWDEARRAFEQFQSANPGSAVGWTNIAITFTQQRRFPEAIEAFQRANERKPGDKTILRGLGIACWSEKRWDEAVASARLLLRHFPDDAEGLNNLGVALTAMGRSVEAEAAISRLLAILPHEAGAHVNRGNLLLSLGRADDALTAFQTARRLAPGLKVAQQYEGMVQLLNGDLRAGWANYEARPAIERKRFDRPLLGPNEPLAGRTILVHAEQGLGDTLQFVRYVPLLAAKGAVVYLEVQPTLKALMGELPGVAAIFGRGETLPEFGCHCPLLSLPYCLGEEAGVIPPIARTVLTPPERVAKWSARLGGARMLRVGVVWSGNPKHGNDHNRSIPLADFASLFEVPGVAFFSLQKERTQNHAVVLAASGNVTDLSSDLGDFADTAGVVEQLDLVIAVDTSVAHLAGSLGKSVWVLVPFAPDWRWLLGRADCPWYPTASLFRQSKAGDWRAPLQAASERLRDLAARVAQRDA